MEQQHQVPNRHGRNENDLLVVHETSISTSNKECCFEDLEESQRLAKARRLLYISHLFAQFSEVAWQFCLVLFLAAFTNYESLFLVSTFGLTGGLFLCIFGSWAGKFVDGTNRLFAAQRFIWTENLCVVVATIFCYILLGMHPPVVVDDGAANPEISPASGQSRYAGLPHDARSILLLVFVHFLGATAQVLDKGFLVAIERDWAVVMSNQLERGSVDFTSHNAQQHQTKKEWPSETNVTMKQIDLSCKVVAPAVSGFVVGAFDSGNGSHRGYDLRGAAILAGAVNAAALVVEYICTARIYVLVPDLACKGDQPKAASSESVETECIRINGGGHHELERAEEADKRTPAKLGISECICRLVGVPGELEVYLRQPVAFGGIGLALLYLNVLTFGGIMTAYLVWRGMRLETVGIWRGISSAAGLGGTFAYHLSAKFLSQESTGMWSICFQFCCISVSFFSLWVNDYDLFLVMFIGGVCLSRVGLWVFDISITQLMQEQVASEVRGVVGGVQQSLNAFFGLFAFALGLAFPDPRQFSIYVGAGYISVGLATILFFCGVFLPSHISSRRHHPYEPIAT